MQCEDPSPGMIVKHARYLQVKLELYRLFSSLHLVKLYTVIGVTDLTVEVDAK